MFGFVCGYEILPLNDNALSVPTSTVCVVFVAFPVFATESVAVADTLQIDDAQVGADASVASAVYQTLNPQSYCAVGSDAPQVFPVVVATHEEAV